MKKVLLVVSLLILAALMLGCQNTIETAIEAETGGDVDLEEGKMTVETAEGTAEIEYSNANGDNWCQEGAEWNYAGTTSAGAANAHWLIEGMITSGEYAGLCHVLYTAAGPDGEAQMDYYFSEDGQSGYFEMNINGEIMKSEWNNN